VDNETERRNHENQFCFVKERGGKVKGREEDRGKAGKRGGEKPLYLRGFLEG